MKAGIDLNIDQMYLGIAPLRQGNQKIKYTKDNNVKTVALGCTACSLPNPHSPESVHNVHCCSVVISKKLQTQSKETRIDLMQPFKSLIIA